MNRVSLGIVLLLWCWLCVLNLRAESPEVANARQHGAQGQIMFCVVDSNGRPVEQAELSVAFWASDSAANAVVTEGQTDTNGCYIAAGKTIHSMNYTITKDGYYTTEGKYWFYRPSGLDVNRNAAISPTSGEYWLYHQDENSVKDGRWQPWNPTIPVTLKERRNPIPMYAKRVDVPIPERDIPLGFDLEVGDWVKPHGMGNRSDLLFTYVASYGDIQVYSKKLKLECSSDQPGLQVLALDSFSNLKSVYSAPEEGYMVELNLERERTKWQTIKNKELNKDEYVVFRTRVVTDKNGEIVAANYGKIYGPVRYGRMGESQRLMFNYYFNPNTNDPNIEFDSSNNLFPDTQFDRVTMP